MRSWTDLSISKKLYLVIGTMASLIACELIILSFAMHTLSAVRAFVEGEGSWSKAQQNAVISLQRYAIYRDESDYRGFLDNLKIPEGDHLARLELAKPRPDLRVVRSGFVQGLVHPDDIDAMVALLQRFYKVGYIARAIEDWTLGDQLLDEFRVAGIRYHDLISSGAKDPKTLSTALNRVTDLNHQLTLVEVEFSSVLSEGSRWMESVVLTLLFAAVMTVEAIGLTLTFRTTRALSRGLTQVRDAAIRIGNGEFDTRVAIGSRDELGALAGGINHMGEMLASSYRDLNARNEALLLSEERFRSLVGSMKDYSICFLGPSGSIENWNSGAERINGYGAPELIGRHFSVLYSPDEVGRGVPEAQLATAISEGRFEETNWRTRKGGRRFWANTVITPILDDHGGHIGFAQVTRDLSEVRRIEELEEAVKTRDEFLSVASHELQTPVTSLHLQQQLVSRLLRKMAAGPVDAQAVQQLLKCAEGAESAGRRLVRVLEQLLDVTRIRAGHLKLDVTDVDLVRVARDALETLAPQLAAERIDAGVTAAAPSLTGRWDRARINQVLTNLLSNAIKYGEGKPVSVEISADALGERALLSVSDRGVGIPAEKQDRIFERFERAVDSNQISGLGLGLYIVQKIVLAHDGRISVRSEPGQGATFTVELPL